MGCCRVMEDLQNLSDDLMRIRVSVCPGFSHTSGNVLNHRLSTLSSGFVEVALSPLVTIA